MENKFVQRKKLKSRYFEKSLRFPVSFLYFFIFGIVLFQNIYSNYGLASLSTTQWIILGSSYLTFLFMEIIEGLAYPKKPYFLMAILLTGIRIILYYFITLCDPTGVTSSLAGFILFTLCFYFHPILVLPILLLLLYVFYEQIPFFWLQKNFEVGYVYELFSFVVYYLLGSVIRLDDRIRLRNQSMIRQLEIYAGNSISLGKQEERNRISRDLHDSLGHQLVAVNIQLQKAVAYREIDESESLEAVKKAQEATNEAIKELRQTIKDLREFEEESDFEDELQKMIQQSGDNGLKITYNHTGTMKGFPEFTLLTLKQVIQEGLTNIEKHAQASQVTLDVKFLRNRVIAAISDDGIGFNMQKSKKEGHYGISGMQERVDAIGGKLKIRSKPDIGTEIIVELPKAIYG